MKYIIVGYDRNRAIGAKSQLPWAGKMKTDMRRLRELTTGNAIIMGRNTYDSIGRALPNRQNIVLTSRPLDNDEVTTVSTLDEAYTAVESGKDSFIFGGAKVYEQALDTVDQILATEIVGIFESTDTFFPVIDMNTWQETSREHHEADLENEFAFDFVTYTKRQ